MDAALKLSIDGPSNIADPSITLRIALINSLDPQTAPPIVSFVPFINLVKLCKTTSAPNFTGEMIIGENVLSTNNFKLCFLAITDKPIISATSSNGLLTASQ